MSVLVTGGSGFIGSKVVNTLAENGMPVISVDLVEPKPLNPDVMFIKADILGPTVAKRIFIDYDISTVIHLIGLPHVGDCERNPHLSFQLNVQSVQQVVEGMRNSNANKIFFASSATVYGYPPECPVTENTSPKPNDVYSYHKLMAEQIIKAYQRSYGVNPVIFRVFNVYGVDPFYGKDVISIFIRRALKQKPLLVKGGRKFRDFVHVEDVAKAFLSTHTSNVTSITINIGSGEKTTIMDVAKIVKSCFHHIEIVEESTPDDGTGIYANITLSKKILGFSPRDPKRGILEHVASYAKNEVKK